MISKNPKALLLGYSTNLPYVYPTPVLETLSELVDWILPPAESAEFGKAAKDQSLPEETEIIFSTWGMPALDPELLEKLPRLEAVFYGAGSVRGFVTDSSWKRGIRIFSAAQANAIPVAEFTIAQLILGLKHVHRLRVGKAADWMAANPVKDSMQGNFRSRVGLVSYGAIARLVRKLLRSFDYEVLVYDPFLSAEEAARENVRPVGLEELFKECHAVSIHTPLLEETVGMIRGHHLESMMPNAVLINTSRGSVVNQPEMIDALRNRPDMLAILDVLDTEPPPEGEPILEVPNAWVTPHVAGSMGHECGRMGAYMIDAYRDFLAEKPSPLEVRESDMGRIA